MAKEKVEKGGKYEVVGPNLTDPKTGKPYAVGTVIELTEKQAENRAGVVIPAGSKQAVGNPALDTANATIEQLKADLVTANDKIADLETDLEAATK